MTATSAFNEVLVPLKRQLEQAKEQLTAHEWAVLRSILAIYLEAEAERAERRVG